MKRIGKWLKGKPIRDIGREGRDYRGKGEGREGKKKGKIGEKKLEILEEINKGEYEWERIFKMVLESKC